MPLRVLLAEDNATNQYVITAHLAAANHDVETVTNGRAAVDAAATGAFDVVLMDVQMPEIDGLAAARAIRALPGAAGTVPIIALTANAMPGDRDTCLAAGMTDYLCKPIDIAELQAALFRACPPEQADDLAEARRSAAAG
jgi:CheY-like chemotaxis protein